MSAILKIRSSREKNVKNQVKGFKGKKEAKHDEYNWTLMYREGQLRKLKVSSLDLYLDKHGISCSRSTLKQDKVDIVDAHIARSTVNNDAVNNEEDDGEDEDSDE